MHPVNPAEVIAHARQDKKMMVPIIVPSSDKTKPAVLTPLVFPAFLETDAHISPMIPSIAEMIAP